VKERIQKVLSDSGIASRRQIEKFIQEKRIFVGDRLAKIGEKISREDQIFLDGKKITLNVNNKLRILALNKPEGFECTRSEKSPKKKIFDLLPPEKNFRWISVGRLDLNTSGLLLLTNNGQIANQLMHPSSMLDREYIARIRGEVEPADIDKLKKIGLDDREISEAVQVISYFNYINRIADGLGLQPEDFIDEKGYKKNLDQ